jgi:hypothetical protein
MVYHLTLRARRPPPWLVGARRFHYVEGLRRALGPLASDVSARWSDDCNLVAVLRYEPDERRGRDGHQAVLAAVVGAAERAGLAPTGALVTRVASHWTQGAIAGALGGLGFSQTQDDRLGPAIALAAVAMGAVAGAFLRRDVPVLRALHLPYAGWRLVPVEPEASGPRFRVGLA